MTNISQAEWKETLIKQVADVNVFTVNRNYPHDTIEYVDITSVSDRRIVRTDQLKLSEAPSRAKRIVRDNDILIATVRPNLKHFCFVRKSFPNLIASTGFAVVSTNPKKADPYFLYYLLTTNAYTEKLSRIAEGHTSAYPSFNPEVIENSPFLLPSLPEQREIAAVLTSLDNKIELLRKQNETLEQIASDVFNEWIVKKSSAENLPNGWHLEKLQNVIELNPNETIRKGIECPYLDMSALPTRGSWAKRPVIRRFSSGSRFRNRDTLFARITPCLENGKTAFIQYLSEGVSAWGSTEFIVMRPKQPLPAEYAYLLARSRPFRNYAIRMMSGTSGRQRVQLDMLARYPVVIPNEATLIAFTNVTEACFKAIKNNSFQSETLSVVRDLLLPKLMSGGIRV